MSTPRPDKFPDWATIPQADPISGGQNIIEPPDANKQTGWLYKQFPPSNWWNWLANTTSNWLHYLDETVSNIIANIGVITGDVKFSVNPNQPSWVVMVDGTIGNTSSGATTRANADCLNLFTVLWENVNNTYAPVSGGRGASASADWNANKTIKLLTTTGRVLANVSTGMVTGNIAGNPSVALSSANNGPHTHSYNSRVRFTSHPEDDTTDTWYADKSVNTGTSGSATPISVVQPTTYLKTFIKL
jgi:hypothetical protein